MWNRVLKRALERLELLEAKVSRAVLRGGDGGNTASLPDGWKRAVLMKLPENFLACLRNERYLVGRLLHSAPLNAEK